MDPEREGGEEEEGGGRGEKTSCLGENLESLNMHLKIQHVDFRVFPEDAA